MKRHKYLSKHANESLIPNPFDARNLSEPEKEFTYILEGGLQIKSSKTKKEIEKIYKLKVKSVL